MSRIYSIQAVRPWSSPDSKLPAASLYGEFYGSVIRKLKDATVVIDGYAVREQAVIDYCLQCPLGECCNCIEAQSRRDNQTAARHIKTLLVTVGAMA